MKKGLSGNQLKLIALICMTVDHVGLMLLPGYTFLRAIGRLAFPIFAYMIAEGCRYTRSMGKYLGTLLASALLCQGVYFFAMGSLYMCIMVTFSLSVALIWLIRLAKERKSLPTWCAVAVGLAAVFFAAEILPLLLPGTDYGIDYGFVGILLPVMAYLCRTKKEKLLAMALGLIMLSAGWSIQYWSLLAVPLLALYSGKRGKWKMKWLFYFYYPIHLASIWLLGEIF